MSENEVISILATVTPPILGTIGGMILYVKNELSLRDKKIKELENQLHDALDAKNLNLPSWTKDINGIITSANAAARRMLFVPHGCEDPVGKSFQDIFGKKIAANIGALDKEALKRTPLCCGAIISFPNINCSQFIIKVIANYADGTPCIRGFSLTYKNIIDVDDR
jgi:hypothetical protein